MSIEIHKSYSCTCDEPGCGRTNPSEDSEFSGWGDEATLFQHDGELTWFKTDDGKTWCPLHAPGHVECGWCEGDGLVHTGRMLPAPLDHVRAVDTCTHCDGNGWFLTGPQADEPRDADEVGG